MSISGAPGGIGDGQPGVMPGRTTRDRLVDAAWDVFLKQPYETVRIAEIAARADVSTGSFYPHFESKEALFRIVASRALDELYSYDRRDPDNAERDPVRDIAYGISQYYEVCYQLRVVALSIEHVRQFDDEVRVTRRGTLMRGAKRLERLVARLQAESICDAGVDSWLTALALQTMTIQLGYDQLVHRDQPQDIGALVRAVTPIWARALGLERWLRAW
jgi:AcrR family transcriptional regulator